MPSTAVTMSWECYAHTPYPPITGAYKLCSYRTHTPFSRSPIKKSQYVLSLSTSISPLVSSSLLLSVFKLSLCLYCFSISPGVQGTRMLPIWNSLCIILWWHFGTFWSSVMFFHLFVQQQQKVADSYAPSVIWSTAGTFQLSVCHYSTRDDLF